MNIIQGLMKTKKVSKDGYGCKQISEGGEKGRLCTFPHFSRIVFGNGD